MWDALSDITLRILLVAAVVSLIIALAVPKKHLPVEEQDGKGWIEGVSLLGTVALVVVVTALQEWEKQKQFRELEKAKNNFKVKVVRGGIEKQLSMLDLLVGDVVVLDTGDQVPADGLFISGYDLAVDESTMTGENDSKKKTAKRDPFMISGTRVTDGVGRMLLLATGMNSRFGRLMASMHEEDDPTPLQVRLNRMATLIGVTGSMVAVATFVVLIIFWIVKISSKKWQWSYLIEWVGFFITAITIVVVAVPEGLPLAVTISLAYSMRQMMDDQNLVRRLAACETMGGATTICSDKTGTLTENRMTIVEGWIAGQRFKEVPIPQKPNKFALQLLSENIALNGKASVNWNENGVPDILGNKSECAMLIFAKQSLDVDYRDLRSTIPIAKLFSFSSAKKRMSTIIPLDYSPQHLEKVGKKHKKKLETSDSSSSEPITKPAATHLQYPEELHSSGSFRMYTKGAAEILLARCTRVVDESGNVADLSKPLTQKLEKYIDKLASRGLRTFTFAYRDLDRADYDDAPEEDLTLVAIVGIMDPVRQGVPEAVLNCQRAGIVVRMVTGDNVKTAIKISEDCGIYTPGGGVLEGPEFAAMTDEELDAALPNLQVLARAQPLDKLRLVQRLQNLGEVVAVTGDGTNDAYALKHADVGLAMGIMGTEVAKSAADIIILDDNFVSCVQSVLWGRNVYDNIRKFIQFQLTVNVVAIIVAFVSAVSQRGTPLKAVQLLWVNLIMDTFAALALGTEKPTPILLSRRPYGRDSPLISPIMWRNIFGHAGYQLIVIFIVLYSGSHIFEIEDGKNIHGANQHYTMIFNMFVYMQIFNELNARSVSHDNLNIFKGIHTNYIFISVIVGTFIVQIILVQWCGPFATTVPLTVAQWFICIVLGAGSLIVGVLLRFIPTPPEKHEKNYRLELSSDFELPR